MDEKRLEQIIADNGGQPSALLAILQDIQAEENWLPREALEIVARRLGVPIARIFRMATFFHALSMKRQGRHICTVCTGTACHVRGASRLVEELERILDLEAGETGADGEWTLKTVNCLGACALAPLTVVDEKNYGAMTPAKAAKLIEDHGEADAS